MRRTFFLIILIIELESEQLRMSISRHSRPNWQESFKRTEYTVLSLSFFLFPRTNKIMYSHDVVRGQFNKYEKLQHFQHVTQFRVCLTNQRIFSQFSSDEWLNKLNLQIEFKKSEKIMLHSTLEWQTNFYFRCCFYNSLNHEVLCDLLASLFFTFPQCASSGIKMEANIKKNWCVWMYISFRLRQTYFCSVFF